MLDESPINEEELAIERQCRTWKFKLLKSIFYVCLRFNILRLDSETDDREPRLNLSLRVQKLERPSCPIRYFACRLTKQTFIILGFLWITYMITNHSLIFALLCRQDYLWNYGAPKRLSNRNWTECHQWNTSNWKPDKLRHFHETRSWLKLIGAPNWSNNSAVINIYNVYITSALAFTLIAGVYVLHHELTIDYFNFIMNPFTARRFIRAEVSSIIESIFHWLNRQPAEPILGQKFEQSLRQDKLKGNYISGAVSSAHRRVNDKINSGIGRSSLGQPIWSYRQHRETIERLEEIKGKGDFRIANMDACWHRKMSNYLLITIFIWTPNITSSYTIESMYMLLLELYLSLMYRIQLVRCFGSNNMQNPKILKLVNGITNMTRQEVDLYRTHDIEDKWANIKLIYRYEVNHYLTDGNWMGVTWYLYMSIYIIIQFALFYGFYTLAVIDKLRWLNQIDEQIKGTISLMLNYRSQELPIAMGQSQRLDAVMESMLMAYINYSLFKRRHPGFERYSDFFIAQFSFVTGCLFLCLYIVKCYIEIQFSHFFVYCECQFILYANISWIISSLVYERIAKLKRNISRMVALATQLNLETKIEVQLFRLQLLSQDDLTKFYANHSIVGRVTLANIVTLNASLMGFWIIMFNN